MTTPYASEPIKASPDGVTFQKDIAYMMHGFGDGPTPLPATVALIEAIVLKQMRYILNVAVGNSERRGHKCVGPEDVIFLMRNNKLKLRRLLQYMKCKKEYKFKNKITDEQFVPDVLMEEDGENTKHRKDTYQEIVESFDDTGSIAKALEFDEIVYSRKIRANRISQSLSIEKYEAYHKARCASFAQGKLSPTRFKSWLCPLNDISMNSQALSVLSYLAYESVAQIVDLAFLVRQDARNVPNEPFIKLEGGNYCNPMTFDNSQFMKSGQGVNPITVAQVREAMRRFSTRRIGTNGLFSRNIKSDMPMKLLAM